MELCIECGERPIFIEKRKLCKFCYGRLQRKGIDISPVGNSPQTKTRRRVSREMDFIKNYFGHENWIYQPVLFRMDTERYSPDFYDGETNTFIEVVGTRQAYFQNKPKYALLKKYYPKIKFEIRLSSGELLNETISINSQVRELA